MYREYHTNLYPRMKNPGVLNCISQVGASGLVTFQILFSFSGVVMLVIKLPLVSSYATKTQPRTNECDQVAPLTRSLAMVSISLSSQFSNI